jgi:hypothetical protein
VVVPVQFLVRILAKGIVMGDVREAAVEPAHIPVKILAKGIVQVETVGSRWRI